MVASGKGKGLPMAGKGGKGLGKGGAKRHRKRSETATHIAAPQLKRLARRAGVKRVGACCYPQMRMILNEYVQKMIHHSSNFCDAGKRKTITSQDVISAFKLERISLVGYMA